MSSDWFMVLMEFRTSPADALREIVARGVVVMAVLGLFVQVVVSSGVVETLLNGEPTTHSYSASGAIFCASSEPPASFSY